MTIRWSGVLLWSLISLACSAVNGCGSVPKHGSDATPTRGAVEQRSSAPSPQESSVRFALWRSCAEMAHPNGYSTADLNAMFERPQSIQQLLQNLKLASERDLLLQPQFYADLTAQKFFAGAKVTRSTPENFGNATGVQLVVSDIGSEDALPMMTVTLESNCWLTQYKPANGPARTTAAIFGFMRIEVASNSGVTLRVVRSVFGHEAENSVDRGVDPHGHVYTPTGKGAVVYPNIERQKIEGVRIETDFYFQLERPAPRSRNLQIVDDDIVTRIEMRDTQHRNLISANGGASLSAQPSGRVTPEPPISLGISLNFGFPSRIGSTLSW